MQSGPFLKLSLRQQLALTPQLQQSIRLLQLSAQDLEAEIAQAILDNPFLEKQEQYDIDAAPGEYDGGPGQYQAPGEYPAPEEEPRHWSPSDISSGRGRVRDEHDDRGMPEGSTVETLSQHLREQLRLTRATPRDSMLVEILVSELDENGYLTVPAGGFAGLFPEVQADEDEWRTALRLLQSFDPPGIGATSLSECLLLQLAQRSDSETMPADVLACARRIAAEHLDLLAAGSVNRLCGLLGCPHELFHAAHALLLELDPRPGRPWAASVADYVVPDVLVRKTRGTWQVLLNPSVAPRLCVNASYERMLQAHPGPQARSLQERAHQAHGFIKGVNQRFATVVRVMQAIVGHQEAFFEEGMRSMRPLLLRDIAQELDMHESTVSRATRQKFVQTPWGVLEIKRFFGTALAKRDGDATSSEAVRTLITKIVAEEPDAKPLSDSRIAAKLAEHGVVVARRTVAKYREAAGIEPASVRKARAALAGSRRGDGA